MSCKPLWDLQCVLLGWQCCKALVTYAMRHSMIGECLHAVGCMHQPSLVCEVLVGQSKGLPLQHTRLPAKALSVFLLLHQQCHCAYLPIIAAAKTGHGTLSWVQPRNQNWCARCAPMLGVQRLVLRGLVGTLCVQPAMGILCCR